MPRLVSLNFLALILLASNVVFAQEALSGDNELRKRDSDSYRTFNHMRNGHACIMSIVFCVLYPLGGIAIYLPISLIPWLRNTYLVRKVAAIHAPIQIIGLVMMLGGMGLGIRIAHDLGYFDAPKYVKAHMVIGLIVVSTIALFQPLLGSLQHRFFKRTGQKSVFGHIHRWLGRTMIILGIINDGLGFQLAADDVHIPTGSYVRNFLLAGILLLIWAGLALYDTFWAVKPVPASKDARVEGELKGNA